MNKKKNEEPGFVNTLAHAAADPFRLLVEGVKDYAIFMLDPDGDVLTWNSGAENIIGYSSREAIGKNHALIYPDEDNTDGKSRRDLEQATANGSLDEAGWRVRKGRAVITDA